MGASNYTKKEIGLLKRMICPDCRKYNIRLEGPTLFCEGAGGLASRCKWFMGEALYLELTGDRTKA